MNALLATLLATAVGAGFAAAPAQAQTKDAAAYRDAVQKVSADYKSASAKCDAMKGNDKDICMAEAKVARARGESQAVAKHENSEAARSHAREKVADADYDLAKEKCDARSGADKDSCVDNAKSVHTAALADAKAGRDGSPALGAGGSTGLIATTDTKDPAKAAAVAKCEQATGGASAGCLVDKNGNVTTMANRAENATERAADKAADATRGTALAASDTAITTKVKAGIFKEPDLKSMAIHVETEQGVVMLSGFVASKAEADKAVKVAKEVDGVASVKSTIKVK